MVNEVKHDHRWVNMVKKGLSQDYLINTFIEFGDSHVVAWDRFLDSV